jgi:UDP-N-acetyl-D-mannosaminuronic acid dehydrogenase
MKVAVIGTGRVGLPLSLSLVGAGVDVVGVDLDPRIRQAVNVDRVMPFREPGFDELVRSGKLHITEHVADVRDADYFVVTVGTPLLQHIETDLSAVTKVILSLCPLLARGQTIIMRSTTAPRTTQYVAELIESHTKFKVGKDIMLACCPERIVEGKAHEELRTLPQIIGAQDSASAHSAALLFQRLGVETLPCDYLTAELVKLFCNVSRYAYFGVINGLAMIAMDLGVEPLEIIDLANRGYPRKLQGKPGFTAGTCLRKDFGMLAESYWAGGFLTEMWRLNEALPKYLVEAARKRYGSLRHKRVAVLGYTFKCDTDDVRDSLAPKLVRYLQRETPACITVTDPFIAADAVEQVPGVTFTAEVETAVRDAEFIFVATNHGLYTRKRDLIVQAVREGRSRVIDIWNVCGQGRVFLDRSSTTSAAIINLHQQAA